MTSQDASPDLALLIDGRWIAAGARHRRTVIDPATE